MEKVTVKKEGGEREVGEAGATPMREQEMNWDGVGVCLPGAGRP